MSNQISQYTNAVLDFAFADANEEVIPYPEPSESDITAFVERTLDFLHKSGSQQLILFGLGSGAYALALDAALPSTARMTICESNTERVRSFFTTNPQWKEGTEKSTIASDISLWAQLFLLAQSGIASNDCHTALCPELHDGERKQYQALQRLFLSTKSHQAINSSYLSHVAVQAPDLSVGAILDPNEPELNSFFAQFPDWIKEIVVVWDGESVPDREFNCAVPIKHFANPLEDFASQRNRMLEECEGEWVLYLDGDEAFSEDVWALFTALLLIKRLEACYFPRMTFYPDKSNCKVGYGLWPDLQLRLFRNHDGIRFERPIHERLTGIKGRVALALDAPILHSSRLNKSPEELTAKLKRFDKASGETIQHVLNDDYPSLARSLFPEASFISGALQVLLLEENPA